MQGEIDKTDGHFSIDYEDGRFRAVQFNPEKREEGSFIAEESISIEDLIKKCREKGLKHLESLSGPAVTNHRLHASTGSATGFRTHFYAYVRVPCEVPTSNLTDK